MLRKRTQHTVPRSFHQPLRLWMVRVRAFFIIAYSLYRVSVGKARILINFFEKIEGQNDLTQNEFCCTIYAVSNWTAKEKGDVIMICDASGATWYKGNLHTHTTRSDGRCTPEEMLAQYRRNGYDFLAMTDHWKPSENETAPNGMQLLAGCEYDFGSEVVEGVFHVVGIGMTAEPQVTRGHGTQAVQAAIDAIHRAGGLAILAHPAWSMNTEAQIRALRGLDGVEIYNTTSGTPWNCRPYSGEVIDQLAARDYFVPCMAADDAHHYNGDACKSYLMVRASECTPGAICAALRRGDFYATQGPHFTWTLEGNTLTIHASPVAQVVFYDNLCWNGSRVTRGNGLTEIHYTVPARERFFRLELTDADGRTAWSSAIPVNR